VDRVERGSHGSTDVMGHQAIIGGVSTGERGTGMKPIKCFGATDNPLDLVDAVVEHGFAAVTGGDEEAAAIYERAQEILKEYHGISAPETFMTNDECVYVIFDETRFQHYADLERVVAPLITKV
jgi:hypothetical protein